MGGHHWYIHCFMNFLHFRSVLSWNVNSFEDINEKSLSLFPTLDPKIDVLIIGIGDQSPTPALSKRIIEFMKNYKINVEVLRTEQVKYNKFIMYHNNTIIKNNIYIFSGMCNF